MEEKFLLHLIFILLIGLYISLVVGLLGYKNFKKDKAGFYCEKCKTLYELNEHGEVINEEVCR